MFVKKVAQELGLLGPGLGGPDVPEKELESKVLERLKELQQIKNPPSATRFFDRPDLADCQIRVTIAADDDSCAGSCEKGGPGVGTNEKRSVGAKRRAATTRSNSAETGAKQPKSSGRTGDVRVNRVHAIMLAQRSPYFEAALTGRWREREDKAIETELLSVEAFEGFRLLLKLSCGGTFVMDDGERVPRDVLLRMLVLSNNFEMVGALTELAGALKEAMTYDEAVDVFRVVPEEIYGHDAIKSLLNHAGDTIAEGLGPVHELWGTGPCTYEGRVVFRIAFPLAAKAKALPLLALERVLRSSKLQVRSENEAFTLMQWWLAAQSFEIDEVEQDAWDRLSKSMRFRRMSCDFLSSFVARSHWFLASSRKAHIFGTCLWHLEMPAALDAYPADKLGPPDRGSVHPRQWTLRVDFTRDAVTNLEEGQNVWRGIGVANGYPVAFGVHRTHGPTLCFSINVPTLEMDGDEDSEEHGGQTSGVIMAYAVRVEDSRYVKEWSILSMTWGVGALKLPISSWEAFVAEESPYFRVGKCRIKVTFRFWKDVEWQEDSEEWYESDDEL